MGKGDIASVYKNLLLYLNIPVSLADINFVGKKDAEMTGNKHKMENALALLLNLTQQLEGGYGYYDH